MSKPSIFSRNYEQKVKRRRLNIILFLLLLVCLAFFGGRYLLKKNNVDIFKNFTSANQGEVNKSETKTDDNKSEEKNVEEKKAEESPSSSVGEYTYTLKNNKVLKLEYTISGENKEIKGFKDENLDSIEYSISTDKKKAVFVDKSDQSLILADVDGNFTDITKSSVNYSNGKKLTRKVLETKKDYIWNGKPQFTSEGNIVYLSDMPNSKEGSSLTLWAVKPNAKSNHSKVTKVSKDISLHNFEGFDEEGRLKLNTPDGYIYISKDGYKAEK